MKQALSVTNEFICDKWKCNGSKFQQQPNKFLMHTHNQKQSKELKKAINYNLFKISMTEQNVVANNI